MPTLKLKTLSSHLNGQNLSVHVKGKTLNAHLNGQNHKCPP